jgi:prepilin peptidase CpaA
VVQLFSIPTGVVLLAALIAAVTDLLRFKVHNILTLPLLVSGLVYHALGGGQAGFTQSLLGALLGFTVLFAFHRLGGIGGGDVKLLAGIGAWLGVVVTFYVFLVSALLAGVYALVLIIAFGKARETWINLQIIWYRIVAVGRHLGAEDCVEVAVRQPDRSRVIPFAAVMALGLITVLVWLGLGGVP